MADQNLRTPGRSRTGRLRVFNRALWRKWSRFTVSGLISIIVGIVVIIIGALLNTGAYSAEGLLIGLGAIIVIVGIVRLLIGFISPSTPEDLIPLELQEEEMLENARVDDNV
jgi:uncharacterized membrane protein HdeD (DUF308 family)